MKNHFLASLRKINFTVIFLLVMSGIIGFFAFIYPTMYDDIAISNGTIDHLDWSNFSLMRMLQIGKSYYDAIACAGHGFIYFWTHFPFICCYIQNSSFLMSICPYTLYSYSASSARIKTRLPLVHVCHSLYRSNFVDSALSYFYY